MKPKEILKILHKDGWVIKNKRGSHIQLTHLSKPGKVTVPYHSKDLDPKTLNSILKQAGLK
ncbi:MAG: type II toxin-antitoxin system HicA family toxin [Firmicutes bacterium]|nr:type II toxin-antitoxin system HicA family toxin [Bacillota bacterium]